MTDNDGDDGGKALIDTNLKFALFVAALALFGAGVWAAVFWMAKVFNL